MESTLKLQKERGVKICLKTKAVSNFRNLGPYFLDWLVRSILIMVINKIHEAVVLQYFFVIRTMLLTGISATVSTSKKTSLSKAVVQANFAAVASHGLNTKNNNFNIFVLNLESPFKNYSYTSFIVDTLRTKLISQT